MPLGVESPTTENADRLIALDPETVEELRRWKKIQHAEKRMRTGRPLARVARELRINKGTLGNRVARDTARCNAGSGGLSEPEREELARLQREYAELAMERDVLERSAVWWVKEARK